MSCSTKYGLIKVELEIFLKTEITGKYKCHKSYLALRASRNWDIIFKYVGQKWIFSAAYPISETAYLLATSSLISWKLF